MNRIGPEKKQKSSALSCLVAMGMLVLVACATVPLPPAQALQAAERAISHAEREHVAVYSSLELGAARENLIAARGAIQNNNMLLGSRLAEQSQANAQLARAKAAASKAKVVNEESQKSIHILVKEMQRNSGAGNDQKTSYL